MTSTRKGVSPLISYAMYIGIGIAAVIIAINTAQPYLTELEDTAEIQNQIQSLSTLSDQIERTAQMGSGAQTVHNIQIQRGELFIDDQSVIYELQTDSGIISSGTRREIGNVILSANAEASLTETTYDGTECYKLENRYIETCIATKATSNSFEQADFKDLLLYIRNKQQNETIEPDINVLIDGNDITNADIRTTPVTKGDYLGTAHLAILVSPPNNPTYTVNIKLKSGSDFLQINTQ